MSKKTVERWIADENLIPHARNRQDAALALKVDEEMIWPRVVKERIKSGEDLELVHSYPYRSACPNQVWTDLVHAAKKDILFAGYTNYFLWTTIPRFPEIVKKKSETGCRIRFLLGDPEGAVTRNREAIEDTALAVSTRVRITLEHLERLGPLAGVETRFSSPEDAVNHVGLSVFRFDDDALVTPHLARLVGHDSPMLHLRRLGAEGLFSRFRDHAEELWERGVPLPPRG
ncbi:XRE family transcriptional regulator [Streptomyces sp. Tu6071]|uniref:XRE family transcriptional regulator n=1 Tax=Streptomyces sp. Tu6071 TaxID=355249 RepID=UPI002D21BC13|nr:XRE family transcriptional regulator [Streptomyces sp. Tu6071]